MILYLKLALKYFPTLYRIKKFKFVNIIDTVDFAFNQKNEIITPSQIREEIIQCLQIIKDRNIKSVLEIGTENGGTLFLISKTVTPDAHIISLDYGFKGIKLLAKQVLFNAYTNNDVIIINRDSHKEETFIEVMRKMQGGLDLLFIDGDHSYEGIKQDFEVFVPLVKYDGIIIFHDIMLDSVKRFWDEIKNNYKHEELISDPKQISYGIGIIYL